MAAVDHDGSRFCIEAVEEALSVMANPTSQRDVGIVATKPTDI